MGKLVALCLLVAFLCSCAPIPVASAAPDKTPSATNPAAIPDTPAAVYQVTADYLNVRSGPGMQYPADPRPLYHGELVHVYDERDGWCRVSADRWARCYWLEVTK